MTTRPSAAIRPGPFLRLPLFEGPLDLLLHLCRRHELPLAELPLAEVTTQFLAYLDVMDELELEVAGEFVEMASLLCVLKSRELLPVVETPALDLDEPEEDPRAALIFRLLAYKTYREAARELGARPRPGLQWFPRPALLDEPLDDDSAAPLDCDLTDLLSALRDLVERARRREAVHTVSLAGVPLAERMVEVLSAVRAAGQLDLFTLLPSGDRAFVVVTFLAILHLAQERRLRLVQDGRGAPLLMEAA
jgi:segregation and condensation protein A